MNKVQPPTINDVALHAGVSTATVSRFLNAPQKVSGQAASKIEAAVLELGYTPNYGARVLASKRTNTVGAVIPTMDNAIFARGLQALQEALAQQGRVLLVASSNYDETQELEQIKALVNQGVECLVLIGTHRSQEAYDYLEKRNISVIISWAYEPNFTYPCVGFDNKAAAQALTKLVLSKGHDDIAMIAGRSANNDRARHRIAGVKQALSDAGKSLADQWLIEADYLVSDAAKAFQTLVERAGVPKAVICGNDVLAVGVLQAAMSMGLEVPKDLSVVGFDDIDLAEVVTPALTTVHVPHRRMGAQIAEVAHRLMNGETDIRIEPLETSVIERRSLS